MVTGEQQRSVTVKTRRASPAFERCTCPQRADEHLGTDLIMPEDRQASRRRRGRVWARGATLASTGRLTAMKPKAAWRRLSAKAETYDAEIRTRANPGASRRCGTR